MAYTANREYPLPDEGRTVAEEFLLLQQQVLPMVDADIAELFSLLEESGGETGPHTHPMTDIEGLAEALAGKMPASATFSLGQLSDVIGADEAPSGYVLIKVGEQWIAQAASAALGAHGHTIGDIASLGGALTGLADDIGTRLAKSANLSDLTNPAAARGNLGLSLVPEEDAETGTSEEGYIWSPLRVAQAIAALAASEPEWATASDVAAGAENKAFSPHVIAPASAEVALNANSFAIDWNAGIYFGRVANGNITIQNPVNAKPGTTRLLRLSSSAATARTIAYGNQFGGVRPSRTVTNSQQVVFIIFCAAPGFFLISELDAQTP